MEITGIFEDKVVWKGVEINPGKAGRFLTGQDGLQGELYEVKTSANSHFVILSAAKDLVLPCIYEILRSLRSLRMTGEGTFAEVSSCSQKPLNIHVILNGA